jgi:hypothetical protein
LRLPGFWLPCRLPGGPYTEEMVKLIRVSSSSRGVRGENLGIIRDDAALPAAPPRVPFPAELAAVLNQAAAPLSVPDILGLLPAAAGWTRKTIQRVLKALVRQGEVCRLFPFTSTEKVRYGLRR